jgi:tetratricopeptide (TPR) repeat protein
VEAALTTRYEDVYYAELFWQRAVENLGYWADFVNAHQTKEAELQRERIQVLNALNQALDLSAAWPISLELMEAFSPYMERWGYWAYWEAVLGYALNVGHIFEDKTIQARISTLLARLLFRQSRLEESEQVYRQTIQLARQGGDRFTEARACSNLGHQLAERGHIYRAEILCCYALKLFETLDSLHGQAHTQNHLGLLYIRQHSWEPARQHLERACDIWQAMPDQHGLMRGLINLGLLYVSMEHPRQALPYLEKALRQAELCGEEVELGRIYLNLGLAYLNDDKPRQAERYARRAETIFRQFANATELARTWNLLGMAFVHQQKWPAATHYLDHALAQWRILQNRRGELFALMDMVEAALTCNNYKAAKIRFNEVEHLLGPEAGEIAPEYLQPRFDTFRRQLS